MKVNFSSPWTAVITGVASFVSGVVIDRYLFPKKQSKNKFSRSRKVASSSDNKQQATEEKNEKQKQ